MIDDLDKNIRALLAREMKISNLQVSFETPDSQFRPKVQPPAINFFLNHAEAFQLHRTISNRWES
jgi:hypothetical protein